MEERATTTPPVHIVVLAGGSGTRFWPASRAAHPKQFLPLAPDSDRSLLADTLARVAPLVSGDLARVHVVTGAAHAEAAARELPDLPAASILVEPAARNTTPCISWATWHIARSDPAAVIVVLPSDHHIADEPAFRATLTRAIEVAREGRIATIGITPTAPETGYGYIQVGPTREPGDADRLPVHEVARFVEKPDAATAAGYLATGGYLWNSGMFIYRADTMADAVRRHFPDFAGALDRLSIEQDAGSYADQLAAIFADPTTPAISIDFGIMEKEDGLRVIPGSFGWSDLGTWAAVWSHGKRDAAGNVVAGGADAVLIDATGCLVHRPQVGGGGSDQGTGQAQGKRKKKIVALVGVSDLCVVDTDDAVIVLPRDRVQDVKQIVDRLREAGREDVL